MVTALQSASSLLTGPGAIYDSGLPLWLVCLLLVACLACLFCSYCYCYCCRKTATPGIGKGSCRHSCSS